MRAYSHNQLLGHAVLASHEGENAWLPPLDVPIIKGTGGLNYSHLFDPTQSILMQLYVTPDIIRGDSVSLFRGDTRLGTEPVVSGQRIVTFRVFPSDIPNGNIDFHYHVYGILSGGDDASESITIKVKRDIPGGPDSDPSSSGINENLLPPVVPVATIGLPLTVTIPAYLNMDVDDTITLSWAGVFVTHTVTRDEVGNPVAIIVSADIVSQHPGSDLVVRYEVRDTVNNWSLWSPSALAQVPDPNALTEPRVPKAPDGRVLDLNEVGSADLEVRIPTARLVEGESVELIWRGQPAEGPAVEYRSPLHTLTKDEADFGLSLWVPNVKVAGLAGGSVSVSYRVTSSLIPARTSLIRSLTVIGQLKELDRPRVPLADGDRLDPAKVPVFGITVYVPAYDFMDEDDYITLMWDGLTEKGESFYDDFGYPVGDTEVGLDVPFTVPQADVVLLAGGSVQVYYSIEPISQPGKPLTSPKLSLAIVGGSGGGSLIPPEVSGVVDGVLDPALTPDFVQVKVRRYDGKAVQDKVTLHWDAAVASPAPTRKTVSNVDRDVDYTINKASYVVPNLGTLVNVWYGVERAMGGSASSSKVPVRIGAPIAENFPPPTVVGASPADVLNPVVAANGATVRVSFTPMHPTDLIGLMWEGAPGPGTPDLEPKYGNTSGAVEFAVPVSAVAANIGKTVELAYYVARGDDQFGPYELSLRITEMPQSALDAPTVPQAGSQQVELDLSSFTGDAQVVHSRWPLIGSGQKIWLTVEGSTAQGPLTLTLASARLITDTEVASGLNVVLSRAELQRFTPGSDIVVRLKVSFNGSSVQSEATSFLLRTLRIKAVNAIIAPRLSIFEAPGDYLNFNSIYDSGRGVTAVIPQYTGMAAGQGQTVRVHWEHPSLGNAPIVWESADIPVTQIATIDVPIPRMEVVDVIGRHAFIHYIVKRDGVEAATSRPMDLTVSDNPVNLAAPRISGDSRTARIPTAGLSTRTTVRLRWSGVQEHDGGEIYVTTVGQDVLVPIPQAWVDESRGTTVLINYSVYRRIANEPFLFSRVWRFIPV
jgi:hypothetical protein